MSELSDPWAFEKEARLMAETLEFDAIEQRSLVALTTVDGGRLRPSEIEDNDGPDEFNAQRLGSDTLARVVFRDGSPQTWQLSTSGARYIGTVVILAGIFEAHGRSRLTKSDYLVDAIRCYLVDAIRSLLEQFDSGSVTQR
jgi:hypothetical protein